MNMSRFNQSGFFEQEFPPDNEQFERIVVVDAVDDDLELSLSEMRHRMISDTVYTCAVFIGGMEGVIQEFELFKKLNPDIRLLPVASTGAASLQLYEDRDIEFPELKSELTYPTLFRNVLV